MEQSRRSSKRAESSYRDGHVAGDEGEVLQVGQGGKVFEGFRGDPGTRIAEVQVG